MKRLTIKLLLMMVATVSMVACSSSEKKSNDNVEESGDVAAEVDVAKSSVDVPVSILFEDEEAVLAAYMNVNDLFEKCGLTENQRKLLAAMAVKDIEEEDAREYVQNAIINLDNTGIKLSEPVYATFNAGVKNGVLAMEGVLVAEVSNVETLDMLVGKLNLPLDLENGVRYVNTQNENLYFTAGYDSDYLVVAVSSENVSDKLFLATLDNADINLSAFRDRDVALYINGGKIMDIYEEMVRMSVPEAQLEYTPQYKKLMAFKENIEPDAKAIIGLTFQDGRVVFDMRYAGINDKYINMWSIVDNSYLQHIPSNALGVVNLGVNGPAVAEVINGILTPEFRRSLARNMGVEVNQISVVTTILCDALASINGDLTVALNDLTIKESYVYEYGEAVKNTSVDIEALLMTNVENNYIMENVSKYHTMLPGCKKSADGNSYYCQIPGFGKINVGQEGNTFYAGINASYNEPLENSIADKWTGEFDNSIAYIAVDIQNVCSMPNVKQALKKNSSEYAGIINLLDSAWLNIRNDNTVELVVTMKDSETNALAQLFNFFVNMAN